MERLQEQYEALHTEHVFQEQHIKLLQGEVTAATQGLLDVRNELRDIKKELHDIKQSKQVLITHNTSYKSPEVSSKKWGDDCIGWEKY
jgi:predicted  nucleic acid-binding Zn-ribbon protein